MKTATRKDVERIESAVRDIRIACSDYVGPLYSAVNQGVDPHWIAIREYCQRIEEINKDLLKDVERTESLHKMLDKFEKGIKGKEEAKGVVEK